MPRLPCAGAGFTSASPASTAATVPTLYLSQQAKEGGREGGREGAREGESARARERERARQRECKVVREGEGEGERGREKGGETCWNKVCASVLEEDS